MGKQWQALWRWAEQAPALHSISLQPAVSWMDEHLPPAPARNVLGGLRALQRRRPELSWSIISQKLDEYKVMLAVDDFWAED